MFGIEETIDAMKGKGASRLPKIRDLEMIGSDDSRLLFAARQGNSGFGEDLVLFGYDIALNRVEGLGKVKSGEYVTSSCEDACNAYAGTRFGLVVSLDKKTGKIKTNPRNIKFGNSIDCITLGDDSVFIEVNGKGIYKLDKDLKVVAEKPKDAVVSGLSFIDKQLFAFDYCGSESGNWPPVRVMNAATLKTERKGNSPGQVRYCTNIGSDRYLLSGDNQGDRGALFSFDIKTLNWRQLAETGCVTAVLAEQNREQMIVGNQDGHVMLFAEGTSQGVGGDKGKVIGLTRYRGKIYATHSTGKIEIIRV